MPAPVVQFNKTMTFEDRQKSLNTLRAWCQSLEAADAKAKVIVLQQLIEYANKTNNIAASRGFFSSGGHIKDSDWALFEAVFRHADLSELLFLKHVINQINSIKSDPEPDPIKDDLLPLAQKHMKILVTIAAHHIRSAAIAVGAFSLAMRFSVGLLVSAIGILYSERIEHWRIARSLDNALALKEAGGKVSRVGDGLDDVFAAASTALNKTYQSAATLFKNKELLASVVGETKETLKPLLENKK